MNKTKDKLTNAVFQDDIPNGASLNEDSIKVYYLEVDINGKTTRGAEVPKEEYELTSSSNKLNIAFKKKRIRHMKLNMQRRLQMKVLLVSKITQKYPAKSKDVSANATVTVSRGTHLAKNSRYNPKHRRLNGRLLSTGTREILRKLMRF